jgi:indoleamine 2,3-dioxygenase
LSSRNNELKDAYNGVLKAMKEFRDAHMRVVTLFVVGPARRAKRAEEAHQTSLKGTGGSDLVKFLKDVRDRTSAMILLD